MKIDKLLKIVMIMLVAIVLVFAAVPVKAADDEGKDDLEKIMNGDLDEDGDDEGFEDITDDGDEEEPEGTDDKKESNDDNKEDEEKAASTYEEPKKEDLPKAGIEDWNMLPVIIGICIISGIYAIKKIKDYENI